MSQPAERHPGLPIPGPPGFLWLTAGLVGIVFLVGVWRVDAYRRSRLPVMGKVPPFRLTDQQGKPLGLADLRGKVWIADFIFTRCRGPCPVMSWEMKKLQDDLPRGVYLVSISVDPEYDAPSILKRYASAYGADPERWKFLTGKEDAIYRLAREGLHMDARKRKEETGWTITHDEHFALVDREGRIRGYYDMQDRRELAELREHAGLLTVGRVGRFPHLNVGLNALTALFLVVGWWFARAGRFGAHRGCMLSALVTSAWFLTAYLVYHANFGSKPYEGPGRPVYLGILLSHTILAIAVVPLALVTLVRALRGRFDRHRRIARWTLPVWLYVSVTGILVYGFLYMGFLFGK